jgi:hypothetical protein
MLLGVGNLSTIKKVLDLSKTYERDLFIADTTSLNSTPTHSGLNRANSTT